MKFRIRLDNPSNEKNKIKSGLVWLLRHAKFANKACGYFKRQWKWDDLGEITESDFENHIILLLYSSGWDHI